MAHAVEDYAAPDLLSLSRAATGSVPEFEEKTRVEQSQPGGLIPKMVVELRDERPSLEEDLEGKGVTMEEGDDGGASDFSSTRT